MRVKDNWAIFVERNEVKWSYGIREAEFQETLLGFISGLGKLGKDLFGESGIASINFDVHKYLGMKTSEIFIISLLDQFHLVISDPVTSLNLIVAEGGIPNDIKEIMIAVLVGQASVLYSTSISSANPKERRRVNEEYRQIILDINEQYLENNLINDVVGKAGSNFSILSFEDLLLLHVYLRRHAEQTKTTPTPSWCIISHLEGGEVPFSYNIEDEILYGGYFAAIIGFISTLFESNPKSIVFGSTNIRRLHFIYGQKYFMAIDTSFMLDLLLKRQFQQQFFETRYGIMKDLRSGLKDLIIDEILQLNEEMLSQLSAEQILDTYVGEGSVDLTLFFDGRRENLELLREEQKHQILRVWGRYLTEL